MDGLAFSRQFSSQVAEGSRILQSPGLCTKKVGTHLAPELPSVTHTFQRGVGPEPIREHLTHAEGEGHVGAVAAAIVGECDTIVLGTTTSTPRHVLP